MGKKHIKRIIKQEVAASMKAASTKSIQSVVVKSTATAAASALEIQPSNIEDGIFSETQSSASTELLLYQSKLPSFSNVDIKPNGSSFIEPVCSKQPVYVYSNIYLVILF